MFTTSLKLLTYALHFLEQLAFISCVWALWALVKFWCSAAIPMCTLLGQSRQEGKKEGLASDVTKTMWAPKRLNKLPSSLRPSSQTRDCPLQSQDRKPPGLLDKSL